jgi:hypothetical protein
MAPGNFTASIDGDAWDAPAVPTNNPWQLSGTGFQTSGSADGRDMTIRLTASSTFEEDEEGDVDEDLDDPIQEVFEDRPGSVDFQLGNQNLDGGDTSLTIDAVTYHTNQDDGGGFLRLGFEDGESGGLILGCFYYTAGAASGDGSVVAVEGGRFILAE